MDPGPYIKKTDRQKDRKRDHFSPWIPDLGPWTLNPKSWTQYRQTEIQIETEIAVPHGHWILDLEHWILNPGLRTDRQKEG